MCRTNAGCDAVQRLTLQDAMPIRLCRRQTQQNSQGALPQPVPPDCAKSLDPAGYPELRLPLCILGIEDMMIQDSAVGREHAAHYSLISRSSLRIDHSSTDRQSQDLHTIAYPITGLNAFDWTR